MAESTIWWIMAGVAVGVELITGTFYLLMIALGLAAAAVGAHFGLSTSTQLVVAAVMGSGAVAIWHKMRGTRNANMQATANRNVNLDIGESVYVAAWRPDGTATVKYRGAEWAVSMASGSATGAGNYTVKDIVGNRLIVHAD